MMNESGATGVPARSSAQPQQSPSRRANEDGSREMAELSHAVLEERQRALRGLLRYPLLSIYDTEKQELFALVRRHAEPLRAWLARWPDWPLDVAPDCIRLYKAAADLRDATRPALNPTDEEPLSRRKYILVCLAFAVMTRSEKQISLGELARSIQVLWLEESAFAVEGLTFDLEQSDSRRDLVAALRVLLHHHALGRVDGDEQRFVGNRDADVLYDVRHAVVYRFLSCRRPPSSIREVDFDERLRMIGADVEARTDEQRANRARASLSRRLLDDTVLYPEGDLTAGEKEYLRSQRPHLLRQLTEATGLHPEDRQDGIAIADAMGDCTDLGLPEQGTEGHATLLVAERLGQMRLDSPGAPVSLILLQAFVEEQTAKFSRYWSKEFTSPGGARELTRKVVGRLAALRLVALQSDTTFVVMPAIHRYRHELRLRAPAVDPTSPSHDSD